ncbi:MAG: hypothetical protein LBH37_00335 [Oscillospiraceae bacterium]|nr:hypothetical protein [Oscillospiraceae bacterium]
MAFANLNDGCSLNCVSTKGMYLIFVSLTTIIVEIYRNRKYAVDFYKSDSDYSRSVSMQKMCD